MQYITLNKLVLCAVRGRLCLRYGKLFSVHLQFCRANKLRGLMTAQLSYLADPKGIINTILAYLTLFRYLVIQYQQSFFFKKGCFSWSLE